MSDDEFVPVPAPSGALLPPTRHPPTAVGVATPEPPRPSRPSPGRESRPPAFVRALLRGVNAVLDVADDVADAVARAVGGRRGGGA